MDAAGWNVVLGGIAILAAAFGLPGTINWMLTRKNANKKLELDEGGLDVTRFNSMLAGYDGIMKELKIAATEAKAATAEAIKERDLLRTERQELQSSVDDLTTKQRDLRALLQSYIRRVGVPMTPEEQQIFDSTKPPPRRPLRATK